MVQPPPFVTIPNDFDISSTGAKNKKEWCQNLIRGLAPLMLLLISNIFMTYAWYGHLKHMGSKPLIFVILASWGIAFFEYCFQVPANRLGNQLFTLSQLKIMQEVITMCVFAAFTFFVMKEKLTLNYVWASLCMVGAVFFIFRPNGMSHVRQVQHE